MMLDQEAIDTQLALLATHRRRLAHRLRRKALQGLDVRPDVLFDIEAAQRSIRDIKAQLRSAGVALPDDPNDAVPVVVTPIQLSATDWRNRSRMIQKVHDFWMRGVLEQSLDTAAGLVLGLAHRPDAVVSPWNMIVQSTDRAGRRIPPGTRITEMYDEH